MEVDQHEFQYPSIDICSITFSSSTTINGTRRPLVKRAFQQIMINDSYE